MNQELVQRYDDAAHAMQSGVALVMEHNGKETTPKHLRVGINSAMVEHSALAKLLIDKGIIIEDDYLRTLAEGMEAEVERYKDTIEKLCHFRPGLA